MLIPIMMTGIIMLPLQQWQESPRIIKLKEVFEETWKINGSRHYTSAIGALQVIGNLLYPKFIGKREDGEVEINRIEFNPISISELPLSEDEIKEIKENGYLIISKFERKESVNA